MKSLLKMTWMESKLFLREPFGTFFTLAFPLILLFLFGSIYGNEPQPLFNGRGTVDISVPAYTAMIIATTGLIGLTITISTYRERGILRRLQTTPISPLVILLAQVIVLLFMTTLGMVLLVIAGRLVYDLKFEGNIISVFLGFLLCCMSFYGIGFILAALLPTARTTQIVSMVILYPMLFLSGAGIPQELLPETVRKISNYLPLTYVVNLLRGLWVGEPWSQHVQDVAILGGIMLVGVFIAVKMFRWE